MASDAAVCCECSLLYPVYQPPLTQVSGFSFKMRTRLTVCDGTGGPQRCEGGRRGPQRGGVEERGPTETEERRLTGQQTEASKCSKFVTRQAAKLAGSKHCAQVHTESLFTPISVHSFGATVSAARQQSTPDLPDLEVDKKHKTYSSQFLQKRPGTVKRQHILNTDGEIYFKI